MERKIWARLRARQFQGAKFRRQVPIGPYVVDFACVDDRLIIELDGGQHAMSVADPVRTADLEALGFRILRFWNNEVMENMEGVLAAIGSALTRTPDPSPCPSPTGRGDEAGEN